MESTNIVEDISNINEIVEEFNKFNNITEIIENAESNTKTINNYRTEQKGGFVGSVAMAFQATMGFVFKLVFGIFIYLKKLMIQLFYPYPWKQKNRAQFYKYVWFCIKCGIYLIIFAIAGPIFIMIGIFMVYGKLFKKMGVSGPQLVRDRISDARQI